MDTGSFGNAIGGASALKQAMQRRGMDASIMDQVSPAGGGTPVAPPIEKQAPTGQGMDQTMQPISPQTQPEATTRSEEMRIALQALSDTVKTENKIAESIVGLR
jgi:hypothetical protein